MSAVLVDIGCGRAGSSPTLVQPVGRVHVPAADRAASSERISRPAIGARERRHSEESPRQLFDEPLCNLPNTPAKALLFASDDANLRSRATQILDDLVACMKAGLLGERRLEIIGYADPRGSVEYNRELALERAESVRRYLLRRGVDASRLSIGSQGESIARGEGPETWMFDRRVEIRLATQPMAAY